MSGQRERVRVRKGYSTARDETEAVREFAGQVEQSRTSVVIVFASSRYDLERLGTVLRDSFEAPVIGCTTSGEITPKGYAQGSLSGVSIASDELGVHPYLITPLKEMGRLGIEEVVRSVQGRLSEALDVSPEARAFGVVLIDGLSFMEERVMAILANAVEDVPIVGGSAGDDLKFDRSFVYWNGAFISDACLFTLFITTLPFATIKTQHFTASDDRLVITKAMPDRRLVQEINGRPAAEEYARVVGVGVDDLGPEGFSANPIMLRFGGEYYVRSIQKVNEDGSLTFYCAIDEGLVLRVAQGENLVENLQSAFREARKEIPSVKLTVGFDCILRRLEVADKGLEGQVNEILQLNDVIGFNTYGEQFNSVHINQTFTGIVLGES